jgi:photosystem II stability/assembly factor-like uncharacterized protein
LRPAQALALLLAGLAPSAAGQAPVEKTPVVTTLTLFAGTARGLFRSRDWGESFERVVGRSPGERLDALGAVGCIVPQGPPVLVGADSGVYHSSDFGETWKRISESGPCDALLGSRYPLADRTLFLAGPAGLLRSLAEVFTPEDAPRTFQPTAVAGVRAWRVDWPGPLLFVGTSAGLHVSGDAGATASRVGRGPVSPLPEGDVTALALSAFFVADPSLVAGVGTLGVFRSTDGGARWAPAGLAGRRVNDLVWLGPFLYAATDAGLFRTEDMGRNWVALNQGIEGRAATRLLFPLAPASGAEMFLGTERGVYWSGDGGLSWRPKAPSLAGDAIRALATFPPPDPVQRKRR